ncbi:hypothetical protein V3C99_008289 [Haemonchus contortus]
MDHLHKSLNSQLQQQRETLEQLSPSIEAIQRELEDLKSVMKVIDDEVDKEETNDETQSEQCEESNTLPGYDEGDTLEKPKKDKYEEEPKTMEQGDGAKTRREKYNNVEEK